MGRTFQELDEQQRRWLEQQPLFFVATAPLDEDGHVNLSPKGGSGSLRVLDPMTVAYLDLTGSGIETVAHLRENGRITLMFCTFAGPPNILRLYGRGRVVQPDDAAFADLLAHFTPDADQLATLRSMVVVEISRIADSCGFVVPRMELVAERDQLFRWADHQARTHGDGWKREYQSVNNRRSIDGLPGLELPEPDSETDQARFASTGRAI